MIRVRRVGRQRDVLDVDDSSIRRTNRIFSRRNEPGRVPVEKKEAPQHERSGRQQNQHTNSDDHRRRLRMRRAPRSGSITITDANSAKSRASEANDGEPRLAGSRSRRSGIAYAAAIRVSASFDAQTKVQ